MTDVGGTPPAVAAPKPLALCLPPDANHKTPRFKCPPGTADCHVHVYGPDSKYPPAPTRGLEVPDALPGELRRMLDSLGVDRVVLVQPSTYGVDNSRHLDAIGEMGRPTRAVISLPADTADAELDRLHELGVRGVRYQIGNTGAIPLDEMPVFAKRLAGRGWHVQLHVMNNADGAALTRVEDMLANLASDLVIDHLGSLHPDMGLDQLGFQTLLRLVRSGRCWVKVSGGYRMSKHPPYYPDMTSFVQALVAERGDRLVWSTDWPHVGLSQNMPNTTDLLDLMWTWVPDEAARNRIFVDNAAALYGF